MPVPRGEAADSRGEQGKTFSCCGFCSIRASTVIQPALFVYCFSMFGSSLAFQFALQGIICYQEKQAIVKPFTHNGTTHHHRVITDCSTEKSVIANTAEWSGLLLTALGLSSCFTSGTIASLSDIFGRRIILGLAAFGQAMNAIIVLVAVMFNLSPYWFLLGYVINGLSGGYPSFLASAFAYAADLTPPKERSLVFGMAESMLYLGGGFGPVVLGVLQQHFGARTTLSVLTGASTLLVIYLLMIPASDAKRPASAMKQGGKASSICSTFKQYNLLSVLVALFTRPLPIVLCVVAFLFYFVSLLAYSTIMGPYTQEVYGWQAQTQGMYSATSAVCRAVGVWLMNYFFLRGPKCSRMKEINVMRLNTLVYTVTFLCCAFAPSSTVFFWLVVLNAFTGLLMPLVRSAVSKSFDETQQGVALTSVAAVEAIGTLWVPAVMGALLKYTSLEMTPPQPRLFLFVSAACVFIAFVLLLVVKHEDLEKVTAKAPNSELNEKFLASDSIARRTSGVGRLDEFAA